MEINAIQKSPAAIINKSREDKIVQEYRMMKARARKDPKKDLDQVSNKISDNQKDVYIPSGGEKEKITYEKPLAKIDYAAIEQLKMENEPSINALEEMVEGLLAKQAMIYENSNKESSILIGREESQAARESIGESKSYTPERISSRIFAYAKALSGLDTEKFETIKSAITKGFEGAAIIMGGDLPELSHKTYQLIMERLNKIK